MLFCRLPIGLQHRSVSGRLSIALVSIKHEQIEQQHNQHTRACRDPLLSCLVCFDLTSVKFLRELEGKNAGNGTKKTRVEKIGGFFWRDLTSMPRSHSGKKGPTFACRMVRELAGKKVREEKNHRHRTFFQEHRFALLPPCRARSLPASIFLWRSISCIRLKNVTLV